MIKKKLMRKEGQSLIEFAIVLPFLLLFLMSIFEFGFMFSSYLTITNGAREGGRLASLGGSFSSVETKVESVSPTLDISKMTVTMDPSADDLVPGESVTVTVTYNYQVVTPIIGAITGNDVLLTSEMEVRVE